MQLSKTDFIQYLRCPESLWLLKNRPEDYPKGEVSLFLEKLIKEGYEVEEYAKLLFSNGIDIPNHASPEFTQGIMQAGGLVYFQPSFITARNAYARIDILERLEDGTWRIYEVKSSSSIKTDKEHNHLKDACFQKYVLTECGYKVSQVFMIHLNKEYVRLGEIVAEELLEVVDVTQDVDGIYSATVNEINAAITFIHKGKEPERCCCLEKTRSNHCDAFDYFNPEIGDHSVYELNRISQKNIIELQDKGVVKIVDIPSNFALSDKNRLQYMSNLQKQPVIDINEIKEALAKLKYPLHFIDYETYPSAIPPIYGLSPHKHLTFQVSIHTLKEDGELTHYEYLSEKMELPEKLIEFMENVTGRTGTFVSWYASFEMSRNKDMMELFPAHAAYLDFMNTNMFDLEKLFHEAYVDYRFLGRTSIKNVLPVLVPELSYKDLSIQDGTMALDTWGRWVQDASLSESERIKIKQDLLDYCNLDTLAMVEIFRVLNRL